MKVELADIQRCMKWWFISIARTVCMITTAVVWIVINVATYSYIIATIDLSDYNYIVLSISFLISAASGAGYLFYRWIKLLRSK